MFKKNSLLDVDFLTNKIVIANNIKIADLGCGSFGYFVFPLAKKIGKHGKIYAVDIIKGNLEAIKSAAKIDNLTQIETIWSNLEIYRGTKLPDNYLDSVLLVSVLHQSKKYPNILKEAIRMTKPGGKILIVEWDDQDPLFNTNGNQRIDKNQLKKELQEMPVKIIEEFAAGKYHYGLLVIKK